MRFHLLSIAAACISCSNAEKVEVKLGDEVCVEGFIMDNYCIRTGVLLDAPDIKSLHQPEEHSFHCLVDPQICRDSGYEVLWSTPDAATPYSRAFRLDDVGNEAVIDLARQTGEQGFCTSCTGSLGSPDRGFRATIKGQVTDMGNARTPASLAVSSVEASDVGCGDMLYEPTYLVAGGSTADRYRRSTLIHGSLMLIGWGWLLPTGAVMAKLGRHRDPLWFNIHRLIQTVSLICSLVGWIIALREFDVFSFRGTKNYTHAVMGCFVMAMGLFQALLGIFRPHLPKEGEEKSSLRAIWEIKHKIFGYGALILAIITIGIGTTLLQNKDDAQAFQIAYGAGVGGLLCILIVVLVLDKKNTKEKVPTEDSNV